MNGMLNTCLIVACLSMSSFPAVGASIADGRRPIEEDGSRAARTPGAWDGHCHDAIVARDGVLDLSGLDAVRARGLTGFGLPLPLERTATADLPGRVAREVALLRAASGQGFRLADDPEPGVPRVGLTIEWDKGKLFPDGVKSVRRYRDLGIRQIGLPGQDPDGLFAADAEPAALSALGLRVIAELDSAGIGIDITHLRHPQKLAVIAASRAPVVASHSLLQACTPLAYNLPEEVLEALERSGGMVWVSFNRGDLLARGEADELAPDRLAEHVTLLLRRLGPARVGIGTDLQAEGRYAPAPLARPDAYAELARCLEARGCDEKTVAAVLGGNVAACLADRR